MNEVRTTYGVNGKPAFTKAVLTDVRWHDRPDIRVGDVVRIVFDTPYRLDSGWNPVVVFGRVVTANRLFVAVWRPSDIHTFTIKPHMRVEVFRRHHE